MICDLCKDWINETLERYVHVEDWDSKKMVQEIWCHKICFDKATNRELSQMEKQAKEIISKAGRIFSSNQFNEMFPKEEEEYIIK